MSLTIIEPDWPAAAPNITANHSRTEPDSVAARARVRALTSTRGGGLSRGPYASLNLANHVGDDPALVAGNRDLLQSALELPSAPRWLNQVHGCAVCTAETVSVQAPLPTADAVLTSRPGIVCGVLTADCLPILLRDVGGTLVAAVHAGWRGLLHGVIEATLAQIRARRAEQERATLDLLAWLGPAIGPDAFEVGGEVRSAFVQQHADAAEHFRPGRDGRWLADLYGLARAQLARQGVLRVSGGGYCTLSDSCRFFSYRRDGNTGRMATLIWIEPI